MKSIYTKLALYGSQNECARTDNIFFPIFEVCNGTVSLKVELVNGGSVINEVTQSSKDSIIFF